MRPKDFIARLMSQQKNQANPYSREHIRPVFKYSRVDNPSEFIQERYGDPPIRPFDRAKAKARREEYRKDEEDEVARIMMEQNLDVNEAIEAINDADELRSEVMKPEWWGLKMSDFKEENGRLINKDGISFPPIAWRNPEDKKTYWALRGYNSTLMRSAFTAMWKLIRGLEDKQLEGTNRYYTDYQRVRTPLGRTEGSDRTFKLTEEGNRVYKIFKDNLDGRNIDIQPVADIYKQYGVEPYDFTKSKQYDILYFKEGYEPDRVPGYAYHMSYRYRGIGDNARENDVRYGDVVLNGRTGTKGGAPSAYWETQERYGRQEPVQPDTSIPARKRRKKVDVSADERKAIRKALDAEKAKKKLKEEEGDEEEEEEEEEEEAPPPPAKFREGVKPSYKDETEFILWLHQKEPTLSTRAIVKKALEDYGGFSLSQPTVQRRIKAFKEGKIDETGKSL